MNLAEAVHEIYRILRTNKVTEQNPSYSDVISLFNTALRKVYDDAASRGSPIEYDTVTISTSATTPTYSISTYLTGILGTRIMEPVLYREATSEAFVPLNYQSRRSLLRRGSDPDYTTNTGTPDSWYLNEDGTSIGLFPVPSNDGYLKVMFATAPDAISRYWGTPTTTTLTASVTNANATVTVSATATGNAATGDKFGVAASETAIPTTWYSTTVSGTTVTLASIFAGATNATAKFVMAQTFTLGTNFPIGVYAAVYYAAALALQDQDPERAALYDDDSPKYRKKISELVSEIAARKRSRSYLP